MGGKTPNYRKSPISYGFSAVYHVTLELMKQFARNWYENDPQLILELLSYTFLRFVQYCGHTGRDVTIYFEKIIFLSLIAVLFVFFFTTGAIVSNL